MLHAQVAIENITILKYKTIFCSLSFVFGTSTIIFLSFSLATEPLRELTFLNPVNLAIKFN